MTIPRFWSSSFTACILLFATLIYATPILPTPATSQPHLLQSRQSLPIVTPITAPTVYEGTSSDFQQPVTIIILATVIPFTFLLLIGVFLCVSYSGRQQQRADAVWRTGKGWQGHGEMEEVPPPYTAVAGNVDGGASVTV